MEHMFVPDASRSHGLSPSVVLGIDPGLTRCGYAVLHTENLQSIRALSLGVIRTPATMPLPQRLALLQAEVGDLISQYGPGAVAVEQVFFQNNVRTAMSVGQASGVVLALASAAGCEVAQYTPSQVKNSVAGWGGADKVQVQRMVQQRLGLSAAPKPADAADAAAIALCHASVAPVRNATQAALMRSAR